MTTIEFEALTDQQGQIAGDFGAHATKQCLDVVMRAMELVEHPAQAQIIAVIAACGMISAAMGSVLGQHPDLPRAKARDLVLAAIGELMDDESLQGIET
jgi:hypothetical protein